ncbi:acyltransferase [Alkalisalibacterium limincola]|uniref:Acyltransferase n=1 Tax=Alkalisalibacterium limincola TaxID=2699169 RepID=A0A5C8KPW4_9GAMM|nr:acyltransferase [Alkalisalibacterium limincola]TXK62279.1 acyltransferase [Alkalisalibacterium limincola]
MSWKQRPEGGSAFALWLIRTIALLFGRRVSRVLLYPITAYFLIVRGPERRASRAYLARVLGRPPRLVEVARHMHCFASTILDRVFLLCGSFKGFDMRAHGLDVLNGYMDRGQGMLLLGSHLGSFEALRVLSLDNPKAQVRVVLDKAQNATITTMLEALNPDIARTVIDAGQDGTSIVLAIREATEQGALVGLLGDRARPGETARSCRFMGGSAPFPTAPWLIASVLDVPVVLCFGLYRGGNRYDLHFELFSERVEIPRKNRARMLEEIQQRYAQRLEHYVRLAPYNWFNFYDFWDSEDAVEPSHSPVPGAGGGDDGPGHGQRIDAGPVLRR